MVQSDDQPPKSASSASLLFLILEIPGLLIPFLGMVSFGPGSGAVSLTWLVSSAGPNIPDTAWMLFAPYGVGLVKLGWFLYRSKRKAPPSWAARLLASVLFLALSSVHVTGVVLLARTFVYPGARAGAAAATFAALVFLLEAVMMLLPYAAALGFEWRHDPLGPLVPWNGGKRPAFVVAVLLAVAIIALTFPVARPTWFEYQEQGEWQDWSDGQLAIRLPAQWSMKRGDEFQTAPIPGLPDSRFPAWNYHIIAEDGKELLEILVIEGGDEFIGCSCGPPSDFGYVYADGCKIWFSPGDGQGGGTFRAARERFRLMIHQPLPVEIEDTDIRHAVIHASETARPVE